MNKISTCTEMFAAKIDLQQTLAILAELKFRYLDLAWKFVSPYITGKRKQSFAELKAMLNAHKIQAVAIMGTIDFGVNERAFPAQMDALRRQIAAASALGADIIRVFASHIQERYIDDYTFQRIISNIRKVCPLLENTNVKLALENHFGVTSTAAAVLRILEGVDSAHVGVTFDPANFVVSREDPVAAAEQLAQNILHVHLKDCIHTGTGKWFGYEYVELGRGTLNYAKILKTLKKNRYKGFLSLEYERPDDVVRGTMAARKHLQSLLT